MSSLSKPQNLTTLTKTSCVYDIFFWSLWWLAFIDNGVMLCKAAMKQNCLGWLRNAEFGRNTPIRSVFEVISAIFHSCNEVTFSFWREMSIFVITPRTDRAGNSFIKFFPLKYCGLLALSHRHIYFIYSCHYQNVNVVIKMFHWNRQMSTVKVLSAFPNNLNENHSL